MPITDPRISRHILTDEDESDEDEYYKQLRMVGNQDYQPTITIELNDNNMVTSTNANASGTANKIKSIIILPPNLSIIQTELIKLGLVKSIGSISIEFPDLYLHYSSNNITTNRRIRKEREIQAEIVHGNGNTNDNNHNTDMDYNYGDQLYRTVNKRENLNNRFYPELTIPIMYSNNEVEDGDVDIDEDSNSNSNGVAIITFPRFMNTKLYNLLSRKISITLNEWINNLNWIVLTPCQLNNNSETINKLIINKINPTNTHGFSILDQIPDLAPPHSFSGITASITSQLDLFNNINIIILFLNCEGSPGYEIFDNETIINICYILIQFLNLKNHDGDNYGDKFLNNISNAIRNVNRPSNSGMYI